MWWRLQRFLYGRYGTDQLNLMLLILGVVLTLFGRLYFGLLYLAGDGLFLWALFRTFSRNISARQRENQKFLRLSAPVRSWTSLQIRRFRERKQYKYFRCPVCKQQLRAPRGRGKIEVTCQKCRHVFQTKT